MGSIRVVISENANYKLDVNTLDNISEVGISSNKNLVIHNSDSISIRFVGKNGFVLKSLEELIDFYKANSISENSNLQCCVCKSNLTEYDICEVSGSFYCDDCRGDTCLEFGADK